MTTTHTSGPWTQIVYAGDQHTSIVNSDKTHIAAVNKKNDAALIAAAPDLLAALQAAVNLLSWGEAFNSDLPDATTAEKNAAKKVDEFKAIIAKATATP